MAGGRPSKLTPKLHENIVSLMAEGNYLCTACAACGITETTYHRWVADGKEAKSGKFYEFYRDIKKAEAQAEAKRLRGIKKLGEEGNWTALAWILERRNPNKWAKTVRHEGGNPSNPININMSLSDKLDSMTEAELEAELDKARKKAEKLH